MLILDARQIRQRTTYGRVAEAIADLLRSDSPPVAPPRQVIPLPSGGAMLVMPVADEQCAVVKTVTVHLENARSGRPAIQGQVLVLHARSGTSLALLDGPAITALRTAAVSLLAARTWGIPEGPLLMIGAGQQAQAHLEALTEGLPPRDIWCSSVRPESMNALVAWGDERGLRIRLAADLGQVVRDAAVIVTATTSKSPVIPDVVRDDVLVLAVGAFRPDMQEIPPSLVERSTIVVDDLAGARHEAGDLLQARVDWNTVLTLRELVQSGAPAHGPRLFKSVGHAFWDLAAAKLCLSPAARPL
ncbi:delta(1)-pyrroline-2-carboxylate reductase family protein [Deinococcus deserti]|uniref:Putative ornithine cyclodeaminase/mu-crystallin n=1 Tax=Deinococcus deserti (strain DSM 17065 / CIP 109153 / LMG 22923 / VCD115) TaxID=546414 RepID=C1D3U6_DEIDV|nr:delta(1)-pyrroline-2-carboxylate reductase family protein [Deinococcus deserti]ACO48175.1 putative ornithine cyclodeaminase/mu-crystallin [Deinococcus deserti VCD115]